ncbi:unnamed protein product [Prunus brigantina]
MDIVSQTTESTSSSPQIVTIQSDNAPFPTGITLTETNYALWSQVMELRIASREKLGYLTGDTPQPPKSSSTYNQWCTANFRVKCTAKEIWDAVKKTYFDGGDETFLFDLNKRAFTIKKNGAPVHNYYNQLQTIFQEIDHRTPNRMHCDADITERQTELDRLRVHLFLAGLDPQFDQVRGEILRKDPKLDLDQTFAYVRREAQQRLTMTNTTVLATQCPQGPPNSTTGASQTQVTNSRSDRKCTHCGGSKHTRAGCYELIGYPDWWDHSKAPRKNSGKSLNTSSDSAPVSPAVPTAPAPASTFVATTGHPQQQANWLWY